MLLRSSFFWGTDWIDERSTALGRLMKTLWDTSTPPSLAFFRRFTLLYWFINWSETILYLSQFTVCKMRIIKCEFRSKLSQVPLYFSSSLEACAINDITVSGFLCLEAAFYQTLYFIFVMFQMWYSKQIVINYISLMGVLVAFDCRTVEARRNRSIEPVCTQSYR